MSEIPKQPHPFPCLHCHPRTYIRMVQNLIERCLLFHMDREQCVKALAEHARIQPLVTLTVWKELLKENKDFFQSYFQSLSRRPYTSGHFKGHQYLQQETCSNGDEKNEEIEISSGDNHQLYHNSLISL